MSTPFSQVGLGTPPPLQGGQPAPVDTPARAGALQDQQVAVVPMHPGLVADARSADLVPKQRVLSDYTPRTVDLSASAGSARALRGEVLREALPDQADLRAWIGADPKDDVTFLGFTVARMSTGYKEVLGRLDDVRNAMAAAADDKVDHAQSQAQLQDMVDRLEDLDAACARYLDGAKHSHKEKIAEFRARVADELNLAKSLMHEARGHKEWPEGLSVADALDLRRQYPSLAFQDLKDLGALGLKLADFDGTPNQTEVVKLAKKIGQDAGVAWANASVPQKDELKAAAKKLHAAELRDANMEATLPRARQWAADARALGVPRDAAASYLRAGVPINERTWIPQSAARIGAAPLTPLGHGAVNTVYRGDFQFRDAGSAQGPVAAVFKPVQPLAEDTPLADALTELAITRDEQRLALRNVATYELDRALGLGITPRTELAFDGNRLHVVMDFAKGVSPFKTGDFKIADPALTGKLDRDPAYAQDLALERGWQSVQKSAQGEWTAINTTKQGKEKDVLVRFDYDQPALRRDMVKMQWLDALTGQVDRHGHNYFLKVDADGYAGLTTIDNDFAFGPKMADADGNRKAAGNPFHGTGMPEVIDARTAAAFKAMTAGDLQAQLSPYCSREEVAAATRRLESIQAKIAALESSGGVIDGLNGWASEATGRKLGIVPQKEFDAALAKAQNEYQTAHPNAAPNEVFYKALDAVADLRFDQVSTASYVAREAFFQSCSTAFPPGIAAHEPGYPVVDYREVARL